MQSAMKNFSRGFLPQQDPLLKLPRAFSAWENLAKTLPKLLVSQQLRQVVIRMESFPVDLLKNERQYERAMLLLSFLGHAYIWGSSPLVDSLPNILAQPWYEVSQYLGRPPVLSYASYALANWQRIDKAKPIVLGNIALAQNFLGGIDEEWFVLVHVDIEAKALDIVQGIVALQKAVKHSKHKDVEKELRNIATVLESICQSLERMPEHCDPYIYFNRVRPYIHGWKNNPSLPNGLIYEGVAAYNGQPQFFRGETGAQSSIIPSLDAALGIQHKPDPLRVYLQEMRDYMPPAHRQFIQNIERHEQQYSLREFIKKYLSEIPNLREYYNQSIKLISRFRHTHLHYAASYIQKQDQLSSNNPNAVGTGGTPFMDYLKKHTDETAMFLL